jgi:hypothetical protein
MSSAADSSVSIQASGVSPSSSDPKPRFRRTRGVSRSRRESEANAGVRNPFRPPYFKRRARNWRAERFRVNALASQPGRSRFARRVRAFAARGCVRGGLWGWASGVARPSAWPTVAGVLADCLSAHRETFPRSGVSVERSRPGDVSEVITADSEGCLPGPSSHCSAAWLPRIPRGALETASCRPNA